jgi:hypothetical protein
MNKFTAFRVASSLGRLEEQQRCIASQWEQQEVHRAEIVAAQHDLQQAFDQAQVDIDLLTQPMRTTRTRDTSLPAQPTFSQHAVAFHRAEIVERSATSL